MKTNTKSYRKGHIIRNDLYKQLKATTKQIEQTDITFHQLVAQAEILITRIETIENELQYIEKQELKNIFNLKLKE